MVKNKISDLDSLKRLTFDGQMCIRDRGQATKQIRNQNDPEILYQASAYAFTGYELMWCIKKGQFDWKKE